MSGQIPVHDAPVSPSGVFDEGALLVFLEGKPELLPGIHDNGTIPGHRFIDGQARDEEKTYRAPGGKNRYFIAVPVVDDTPVATDATAVEIEVVGPDDLVGIGVPLQVEISLPSMT